MRTSETLGGTGAKSAREARVSGTCSSRRGSLRTALPPSSLCDDVLVPALPELTCTQRLQSATPVVTRGQDPRRAPTRRVNAPHWQRNSAHRRLAPLGGVPHRAVAANRAQSAGARSQCRTASSLRAHSASARTLCSAKKHNNHAHRLAIVARGGARPLLRARSRAARRGGSRGRFWGRGAFSYSFCDSLLFFVTRRLDAHTPRTTPHAPGPCAATRRPFSSRAVPFAPPWPRAPDDTSITTII